MAEEGHDARKGTDCGVGGFVNLTVRELGKDARFELGIGGLDIGLPILCDHEEARFVGNVSK